MVWYFFPFSWVTLVSCKTVININYLVFHCILWCYQRHHKKYYKQESPPAWTQEACRPQRIKYSICCPIPGRVGTLVGGWIPWGTPPLPIGTWGGRYLGVPHRDLAGGRYLGGPPVRTFPRGWVPWPGVRYLGVSPSTPGCQQTDTCENSTLPSYHVRGR